MTWAWSKRRISGSVSLGKRACRPSWLPTLPSQGKNRPRRQNSRFNRLTASFPRFVSTCLTQYAWLKDQREENTVNTMMLLLAFLWPILTDFNSLLRVGFVLLSDYCWFMVTGATTDWPGWFCIFSTKMPHLFSSVSGKNNLIEPNFY